MHGPTFMANPLARSTLHILKPDWQGLAATIENSLKEDLFDLKTVKLKMRVLGLLSSSTSENIDMKDHSSIY